MKNKISSIFIDDYYESRNNFINSLKYIKKLWKNARLESYGIEVGSEEFFIDVIRADAEVSKDKLLLFTTGEHGIEGYVGTAMLRKFICDYIEKLDSKTTGIVLVHAINPWGMKNMRRANENNVDLNRNFIPDWSEFDKTSNKGYKKGVWYFQPNKRIKIAGEGSSKFKMNTFKAIIKLGIKNFKSAALMGQYEMPKGIYYGGSRYEKSTEYMIKLYDEVLELGYNKFIHLDMHTGYGAGNQMTVVNSCYEEKTSQQMIKDFSYPLIQKENPEEFYAINGDMIDYMYIRAKDHFKGNDFYATAFEFGTFGESLKAGLRSLKTSIEENTLYWNGAEDESGKKGVQNEFKELFAPSDKKWREKAIKDFQQAIEGILKNKGYIV